MDENSKNHGLNTYAAGDYSYAEGNGEIITNSGSYFMHTHNLKPGDTVFKTPEDTIAIKNTIHNEGIDTTQNSSNDYASAEDTIASSSNDYASAEYTIATAMDAHAYINKNGDRVTHYFANGKKISTYIEYSEPAEITQKRSND
jgi:hypothetical protein